VGGGTLVVYDSASGVAPDRLPLAGVVPAEAMAVPVAALAREAAGTEKAKNTVVLGLLAGWLGLPPAPILGGLRRKLARKAPEVLAGGERAFAAGLAYADAHPTREPRRLSPPPAGAGGKLLADGNEMCAAAAIFAGCEFFGGYPITPSTEIMQLLARDLWRYGGTVLQAEDEIAGLGAVVGASFAGKKAMTATSGPGLSLKTEMLGLATIAELPLVCVDVQRGGPSTGIPTKSEQSDLFQAVFSAHGDVVRPVLAPTSVADTFVTTVDAFNIAEEYQTPVLVLSDQEIAQRKETVDPIDTSRLAVVERLRPAAADLEDYARFRHTESGISPISHPGCRGQLPRGRHRAQREGRAHGERGSARAHEREAPAQAGPAEGNGPISSTWRGPRMRPWPSWPGEPGRDGARGAAPRGRRGPEGQAPRAAPPLPRRGDGLRRVLPLRAARPRGRAVAPGQLFRLLRMFVDVPRGVERLARSGANPIRPDEVLGQLRQMAMALQRVHEDELQPQE
jgi:2-oxoglutarate ferredoxin oxidoreductase subunit alpha